MRPWGELAVLLLAALESWRLRLQIARWKMTEWNAPKLATLKLPYRRFRLNPRAQERFTRPEFRFPERRCPPASSRSSDEPRWDATKRWRSGCWKAASLPGMQWARGTAEAPVKAAECDCLRSPELPASGGKCQSSLRVRRPKERPYPRERKRQD